MDSEDFETPIEGDCSNSSVVRFAYDSIEQPSTAVARAVGRATDRDPLELDPLYEYIDTDALDTLIESSSTADDNRVNLTFQYEGVMVRFDTLDGIEVCVEDY